MIKEIQAKVLLSHVKQPDTWFGLKYNMNLYRGCIHRCIYCDSRSECYQIKDFDGEVLVKVNAPELLRNELSRKRVKGVIGLGAMNDPFMPLPSPYDLTPSILKIIAQFRFPVHIITKSDRVLRVIDTLAEINEVYASISFTVTTADDALAARVEPFASRPSARFAAMRALADRGIQTGVTLMPVLPFIEDTPENITAIIEQATANGASYVIPSMGMTMRDRQRAYFYEELDRHFPGLHQRYAHTYGERYGCESPRAAELYRLLDTLCRHHGLPTQLPLYPPQAARQLELF
ncbi:MAG: radical SAM protein [Chloroflexi bacterium]|nr:radical SAM protein [Chloroflexota bacterium]